MNDVLRHFVNICKLLLVGETSVSISTKQFQQETDLNPVWDFMVEIYDREKGGGVAAPFFEYALAVRR